MKKVPLLRGKVSSTCSSRTRHAPAPPSRSPPNACPPTSSTSTSTARRPPRRDPARHHRQPLRDARRHVRRPPRHLRCPYLIAEHLARVGRNDIHVVNAGDGRHAHPTQGLLDMHTDPPLQEGIPQPDGGNRRRYPALACRPLRHSRTQHFGAAEVRAIGPQTLLPTQMERMGFVSFTTSRRASKAATW